MQKIRKILRAVSEIFKDGRTDQRTDMGDYIGPSRVNPGSKKIVPFGAVLDNCRFVQGDLEFSLVQNKL